MRHGDIFYDRGLLERAGLTQPYVVGLYEAYCRRLKLEPAERPLTTEAELLDILVKGSG